MTEMNKIDVAALENVIGGAIMTVRNDAVNYANVRETAGLKGVVLARVPNGTKVRTTGKKIKKDGYTWYEITLLDGSDNAWIASSLLD